MQIEVAHEFSANCRLCSIKLLDLFLIKHICTLLLGTSITDSYYELILSLMPCVIFFLPMSNYLTRNKEAGQEIRIRCIVFSTSTNSYDDLHYQFLYFLTPPLGLVTAFSIFIECTNFSVTLFLPIELKTFLLRGVIIQSIYSIFNGEVRRLTKKRKFFYYYIL